MEKLYYVAFDDSENEWWVYRKKVPVERVESLDAGQTFCDHLNTLEAENEKLKVGMVGRDKTSHERLGKAIALSNEVTRLKARCEQLKDATLAYRGLNVCYRIGSQPSEQLFRELRKADAALADSGADT